MTTFLKINTSLIKSRNFHTSTCLEAKAGKAWKAMGKVMGFSSKKKRAFCDSNILPSVSMFSKGSQEGRFSGSARRASVLNKLFMKHITDLMATGEYSSEFLGHGIEINRVQITPDYKGLNVYWVAKGTQNDDVVEKLLKKNSGFLRHELSSLRVVGVVPMINFLKDKQCSQIMEVDSRLAKADFGVDYVMELGSKLKAQLELHTPLPSDVKNKLQEVESSSVNDVHQDESLPPMPQDVLGLDHAEILNRIKKNMKKSEATHRFNDSESPTHTVNKNPIEFASDQEQRAIFKQFLAKRELLRMKARKQDKKYIPDLEYMREELLEERNKNYFQNMDIYEDQDDYITEDEDDVKSFDYK